MFPDNKRIYKKFDKIDFGTKCKGEALTVAITNDPQYIRWCLDNIEWFDIDEESLTFLEDKEAEIEKD